MFVTSETPLTQLDILSMLLFYHLHQSFKSILKKVSSTLSSFSYITLGSSGISLLFFHFDLTFTCLKCLVISVYVCNKERG